MRNNYLIAVFILLQTNLFGQRVGVIEKNRFSSMFVGDTPTDTNTYKLSVRELFEKKNGIWESIWNWPDEDSSKTIKTKTHYLLEDGNKKIIVKGTRNKNDAKAWLAGELFRVENPIGIKLYKLPESIMRGFEEKDIIASRIVTDKSVQRINKTSFKKEPLSDTLKNRLYDLLIAKYDSCYLGYYVDLSNDTTLAVTDTAYWMTVKKRHIHNTILQITDSVKVGKVDIASGNLCFAEPGRSYGGGILNYIVFPNGRIKLLVTNTELIDVADYDNDGKYEYIFFKSTFNNYGYIMYYDNFEKHVMNDWSYH